MDEAIFDAVVIGGGPAGSSVAIRLAEAGKKVCIVDREDFPRFRIGESLLPASNPILRKLGIWETLLSEGYVRKFGAEFLDSTGQWEVHNVFANGMLPVDEHTFQVERARFDKLLIDRATALGVTLITRSAVKSVDFKDDGSSVHLADGRILRGYKILDSTGRDCLLARQLKIECDPIPYPPKIAVYSHFENVGRREGLRSGNITIVRLPGGWFWSIPLDETKTSVGVVSWSRNFKEAKLSPEAWFDHCCKSSPFMDDWMRSSQRITEIKVTGDYTFQRTSFAGDHYFLIGDAAAFIDPIFSSGVCLALGEGDWVADYLIQGDNCHRRIPRSIQSQYTREWKASIMTMRRLIEVFYDPAGSALFLQPSNRLNLFDAINSIVAGHTRLPWKVAWRFQLFLAIVALNKRIGFAGKIGD